MALLLMLSIEVPTYSDFIAYYNLMWKMQNIILYYLCILFCFLRVEWEIKKNSLVFYPIFLLIIPQLIHTMRAGTPYRWDPTVTVVPTYLYYHFDKSTLFGQILVECYFLVASLVDALVQVVLLECIPPRGVFQVWWWSLKMVVSYRRRPHHCLGYHLKFLHFGRRVEQ